MVARLNPFSQAGVGDRDAGSLARLEMGSQSRGFGREDRRREGIGKIIYIAACIVGFVVLGLVINFVRDALRPPCDIEHQGACLDSDLDEIRGGDGY